MDSINIDQPLSTPAHEWAADTTNALKTTSYVTGHESEASTPGVQFPGAFPGGLHSQSEAEKGSPHEAAKRLADAAPPKSTSDIQEPTKAYFPNVDVQKALDAAKAYLPESVVGAVGSVLPSGHANGQSVEKNIDPTSGAKPASAKSPSSLPESVENASTSVNPPSTRSGSFTSSITGGERTPPTTGVNDQLGSALDTMSQAKPNTTISGLSAVPVRSVSGAPAVPGLNSPTHSDTSPINASNTTAASYTLPMPPASASDKSSPADSRAKGQSLGDPSTEKSILKDGDAFPRLVGISRIAAPTNGASGDINDGPTPPPKDEPTHESENSASSQPTVTATPAQKHVKSGTAAGARLPGTGPVGGEGVPQSFSPKSEISSPHVEADATKDPKREEKIDGIRRRDASASSGSSDDGFGGNENENGNGNGGEGRRKEGRVKKVVHKVKDKLSHRSH